MKKSETKARLPITSVILLCLVVLSNCAPDAAVTTTTSPLTSPIYESPISTPSGTEIYADIRPAEWDATPEPGMAVVKGQIQLSLPSALLGELFLAKAMATSNPEIELLELDQENAPMAVIARESMAFVFLNIEPGRYGIIAWEPMNAMVLNDPATGQTLYIDVKADDVIDVGVLSFP